MKGKVLLKVVGRSKVDARTWESTVLPSDRHLFDSVSDIMSLVKNRGLEVQGHYTSVDEGLR